MVVVIAVAALVALLLYKPNAYIFNTPTFCLLSYPNVNGSITFSPYTAGGGLILRGTGFTPNSRITYGVCYGNLLTVGQALTINATSPTGILWDNSGSTGFTPQMQGALQQAEIFIQDPSTGKILEATYPLITQLQWSPTSSPTTSLTTTTATTTATTTSVGGYQTTASTASSASTTIAVGTSPPSKPPSLPYCTTSCQTWGGGIINWLIAGINSIAGSAFQVGYVT